MPLTSIALDQNSNTNGTFTDIAGQEVTVNAVVTNSIYTSDHGASSTGHLDTGALFGAGSTMSYTFSGDGVNGLAVQIGAAESSDSFDFVINGVDVNLQDMIDAGEAQLVHPEQLPFTPHTSYDSMATVTSNGDLSGRGGPAFLTSLQPV